MNYRYLGDVRVDQSGPNFSPAVLQTIRLPRWTYESQDMGASVFGRAQQRLPIGLTDAKLKLRPAKPLPAVELVISVYGRWEVWDEDSPPPPGFGDLKEEAEALLILLGCRSPRFRYDHAWRTR